MTVPQAYVELTPELARRWDRFVGLHPNASLYHHSRWVAFAADAFGFDTAWLTLESDTGEISGVLPMIRQRSRLFGDRWVSLPFFNYGGPLVTEDTASLALIELAARHAQETGVGRLEIRDIEARAGVASRTDKATLVLDLPSTAGELTERLGAKLRSQIRRADREAPEILRGGVDLVPEFYAIFAETMRDLGTPVLPPRFFTQMFERVGGDCHVLIVRLGGRSAAAALLTRNRGVMEIPWAGNLRQFRSAAANMRLYWECLRYAIETGHRRFDFGRSTVDSGTYRFKQQWGAQPRQLHWHYPLLAAEGEMTSRQYGSLVRAARAVWRHLPVPVATGLGTRLSAGLPW